MPKPPGNDFTRHYETLRLCQEIGQELLRWAITPANAQFLSLAPLSHLSHHLVWLTAQSQGLQPLVSATNKLRREYKTPHPDTAALAALSQEVCVNATSSTARFLIVSDVTLVVAGLCYQQGSRTTTWTLNTRDQLIRLLELEVAILEAAQHDGAKPPVETTPDDYASPFSILEKLNSHTLRSAVLDRTTCGLGRIVAEARSRGILASGVMRGIAQHSQDALQAHFELLAQPTPDPGVLAAADAELSRIASIIAASSGPPETAEKLSDLLDYFHQDLIGKRLRKLATS
jgi:hypothetical protein